MQLPKVLKYQSHSATKKNHFWRITHKQIHTHSDNLDNGKSRNNKTESIQSHTNQNVLHQHFVLLFFLAQKERIKIPEPSYRAIRFILFPNLNCANSCVWIISINSNWDYNLLCLLYCERVVWVRECVCVVRIYRWMRSKIELN